MNSEIQDIPRSFEGIGYVRSPNGFPLQSVQVPVPRPGPDQVLIHTAYSSLNPLDYKLADLNFFKRTPPVILGLDLAGTVIAVGGRVKGFDVGDQVAAMADCNGDGGWATGGRGGYALARDYYTTRKPGSLSFVEAAALPLCFIAAHLGLERNVEEGDVVYIPGGAGGVGHLAIRMARNIFKAGTVVSSGSTAESMALARASGADHVFNYKQDNIATQIAQLTQGRGVDVVFDVTYSEQSFIDSARMVRDGGKWIVLGVGPGKTTRTTETESPVAGILADRGARMLHVNMLRYFQDPDLVDDAVRAYFSNALRSAMDWAVDGRVKPHVDRIIPSRVDEINAALAAMKSGKSPVGKVVVQIDLEVE